MQKFVTRHRHGQGFTYRDHNGRTVKNNKLREWIESLAIPPAWEEVEIDTDRSSKLHAWGRDTKGRKQYIYNETWRAKKEQHKFDRIIEFAQKLPHMRRVTGQHMRQTELNRNKVLATMVRLLDTAYFRPGNEYYAKENETFGLTTLRSKHVEVSGSTVEFNYIGKSNKHQHKIIEDKTIAQAIKELDDVPGYELFQYFDGAQKIKVSSEDLNLYIREVMGNEFSAKDFRTWAGTYLAAVALNELGATKDERQLPANLKKAVERVAEHLGNTPDIAKSSYIDPRILSSYENGVTLKNILKTITEEDETELSSPEERAVLALLNQAA